VGLVTVPADFRPSDHLLPMMNQLGVTMFPSPPYPEDCPPGAMYPGTHSEEVSHSVFEAKWKAQVDFRKKRLIAPVLSQIEPLRAIIRDYQPSVVLTDTLMHQAAIASHLENRPYVGFSASLRMVAPAGFQYEPDAGDVRSAAIPIYAQFGMQQQFASIEFMSPYLNIVFSLPTFVGHELPDANRIRLVGPPSTETRGDEVEFPWDKLDSNRPLVYISFGSVLRWQPDLLDMLIASIEPLGVQCVVSAGELALKKTFPANIIARPYVPQIALLKRAHVFVTVGGANSVNEALSSGVPMLVMPRYIDQPLQGHFVEASGVGLSIPAPERSVERIRDALRRLLDPSQGYKERVQVVQTAYAAADGGRNAAALIAALPH
jgi:MGT family glycosyltransferase